MDGSALERPIVVLWIAHVAGYPLNFGEQLVVALTSALISVGEAGGVVRTQAPPLWRTSKLHIVPWPNRGQDLRFVVNFRFPESRVAAGSSPIPSAGLSTLLVMVQNANVPLTPQVELLISFCLAIEWLLDSVRTTVNVTGDAVGVAIIDQLLAARAKRARRMPEPGEQESV